MANCRSCNDLYANLPDFMMGELTNEDIASIKNNQGLQHQVVEFWNNHDTVENLVGCLIRQFSNEIEVDRNNSFDFLKEKLIQAIRNFETIFEVLNASVDGLWEQLRAIKIVLNDLDNTLSVTNDANWVQLQAGIDFSIQYHNGFFTAPAGQARLLIQETPFFVKFKLESADFPQFVLRNNALNMSNVTLTRDNWSDVVVAQQSNTWLAQLTLNNQYTMYRDWNIVRDSIEDRKGFWNVAPAHARMSWEAEYNIFHSLNATTFTLTMNNYLCGLGRPETNMWNTFIQRAIDAGAFNNAGAPNVLDEGNISIEWTMINPTGGAR